jgi:hypothetical protein
VRRWPKSRPRWPTANSAGEGAQELLKEHNTPQVHSYQHRGEKAVEEGTVYKEVYVVEPVAQDRYAHRNRPAHEANYSR